VDQSRFENALAMRESGRVEDAIREFLSMASETDDINVNPA
jgi:hypothetical protein